MPGNDNLAIVTNDEPHDALPKNNSQPNNVEPAPSTSSLNANTYASKKSLAQGMLDLALLAANACQLKYILTTGESHEFYGLLLTLVLASIGLQVLQAVICVILGLILDINKVDQQKSANIVNNISLSIVIVVVVINVIISAFDIKAIESQRERAEIVNGTTIAPPSD